MLNEWLMTQWQGLVTGAVIMLALAVTSAWMLFVWQQKRWQKNVADQLEEKIQYRTWELQITLSELAEKNELLEKQNTLDSLTGVRNRAFFEQKLIAELKRCRRERSTLSLLMLDIDYFKNINDHHGHLVGDAVLKQVASAIASHLKRSCDHLCRYGGEEFAIILPSTGSAGALLLAEQIRQSLEELVITQQELTLKVSASIGCYSSVPELSQTSYDFIQAADIALYQAKQAGRNTVIGSALSQHPEPIQEIEFDEQDQ